MPCQAALLAAVTALLTIAVQVPFLDRPFDRSMASIVATRYTSRVEHAYRKLGFAACAGIPQVRLLPGEAIGEPYLHHPPGYFWLNHALVRTLGHSEATFRLLPIVAATVGAALLVLLVAEAAGVATAAVAALCLATSPMGFFYGAMAGPLSPVLTCTLAVLWLHGRLRGRSRVAYSVVPLVAGLGTFVDWAGAFAVPAVVGLELGRQRGARQLGRVVDLAVGVAIAALAALTWFVAQLGPAAVVEQLRAAVGSATGIADADWSWTQWLRNQLDFWIALFTLPATLATAVALPLLVPAWRCRDPRAGLAVALSVPALLFVVLFPEPAFDHECWWYPALPAVAFASAVLVRALWRRSLRLAPIALTAWICGAGLLGIARRLETDATTQYRDFGAAIAAFAAPEDLVLSPRMIAQEHFYIEAFTREGVNTVPGLDDLIARWRAGSFGSARMFFLMSPDLDLSHPELAARVRETATRIAGHHDVVWQFR